MTNYQVMPDLLDYDEAEVKAAFQHWALEVAPEQFRGRHGYMPTQEARIAAARALREIRDRRLYRGEYNNFYLYCASAHGILPDEANNMIAWANREDGKPAPEPPPKPPHPPEPEARPSFVYFIQCGNTVKIGVAVNAEKRRASLQIGNPTPLILLTTIHGDEKTERELHKRFAADRVSGEWFALSPELRQYIGGLK